MYSYLQVFFPGFHFRWAAERWEAATTRHPAFPDSCIRSADSPDPLPVARFRFRAVLTTTSCPPSRQSETQIKVIRIILKGKHAWAVEKRVEK
jgi:hypothetical protein